MSDIFEEEFDAAETGEGSRTVRAAVPDGGRVRLDAFLAGFAGESRSRVKRLVEDGHCLVDGKPCVSVDLRLRPGQTAELSLPEPQASPEAEDGPLDILYSDEDIAVINKPAGLTMHPCPSCPRGTLVNRLIARFPRLALQEGPRPGIVHRLDKDTSGLVVAALSERARLRLAESFAAREVHKTYLAITRGTPRPSGECALPVGRHPTQKTRMAIVPEAKGGRSALTKWETLYALPDGKAALLAVRIFTGRTHQIRVHMAQEGHPLIGDTVYGPRDDECPAGRQMLHAWKLSFRHPADGHGVAFLCPPPEDFTQTLLALADGMDRLILTGMPGCGKSAVLRCLAGKGIPAWSADEAVSRMYRPGSACWQMMRARWGDAFLDDSGAVDRKKLSAMLAERPGMRRELEAIIHPLTREEMLAFFRKAEQEGTMLAAAEVPLWFECGWEKPLRTLVAAVACPDETRRMRLAQERGWNRDKIAAIESWQWSARDKENAADIVLHNAGSLEDLERTAGNLLQEIEERRSAGREALSARLHALWGAS